jgi:hypothetical protein
VDDGYGYGYGYSCGDGHGGGDNDDDNDEDYQHCFFSSITFWECAGGSPQFTPNQFNGFP